VATTTLPQQAAIATPTRAEMVLKHYGAPFLIVSSSTLPDLIGYVYSAGDTPAFGLLEALTHVEANFPTFGPINLTRPCDFHSVLWLADLPLARKYGIGPLSAHTLSRQCPHCAEGGQKGEQLTMLNQGAIDG